MLSYLFPQPKPALRLEYRRQSNINNISYVRYFSLFCCIIFSLHLLHHLRLGLHVFSAEMMPYTLIYAFCILYPGINLLVLSRVTELPSTGPLAGFIEMAFPSFMMSVAVILALLDAQFGHGISAYVLIAMTICFLAQGQLVFLAWTLAVSWAMLAFCLFMLLDSSVASPCAATAFSSSLVCLILAHFAEHKRIRQFERVTELQNSNRQLQMLSSQDPLTELLNRRSFGRVLEREMSRSDRFGHALSLIIIDIDNFKIINDTYGHVQGDEVIRQVAQSIRVHVRDVDYVGRMGGDEFVVLLIETDKAAALHIANRMCTEVSKIQRAADGHALSISIGLAQSQGESYTALIERADKALYEAKKAGKNRVRSAANSHS